MAASSSTETRSAKHKSNHFLRESNTASYTLNRSSLPVVIRILVILLSSYNITRGAKRGGYCSRFETECQFVPLKSQNLNAFAQFGFDLWPLLALNLQTIVGKFTKTLTS